MANNESTAKTDNGNAKTDNGSVNNGNASNETSFTERATRAAHEAVDRLGAQGSRAEERLRTGSHQASARSQEVVDQACAYVKDKPLQSLGIAAAAGFLLGSILRR